MIVIDVCLSDIAEWARKKGQNGKVYSKFCVVERKEKDKYENTHTVYLNPTKEQREAKEPKSYVGSGKQLVFNATATKQEEPFRTDDMQSLPF